MNWKEPLKRKVIYHRNLNYPTTEQEKKTYKYVYIYEQNSKITTSWPHHYK